MGEIRSTLDIIMEKAGKVKVTDEEKAAFMKREVEGRVRGLLQKYLDGQIKQDRLREEFQAMDRDRLSIARNTLRNECLERVDPDGDNGPLMEVMEEVLNLDTAPLRKILSKYRKELDEKEGRMKTAMMEELMSRGISGSAVEPNLRADGRWIGFLTDARKRLRGELDALMGNVRS